MSLQVLQKSLRSFSDEQEFLYVLYDLVAFKAVDLVQVIDVGQDEVQSACLVSMTVENLINIRAKL